MTMTAPAGTETASVDFPEILPMGLSGMLVRFADRMDDRANRAALAFRAAADAEGWPGVAETATSLASVFLRFDPLVTDHEALGPAVAELLSARDWYAEGLPAGRRRWHIPTVFDGPQLADAARLAGVTPEAAVEELSSVTVRVLTIGFAPGLPYMGPLPERWDIPRQSDLTPVVPECAVVLAVRQLIIFPTATPTGWRQIGRTLFRGFQPEAAQPFPLRPGDEVRLLPVGEAELARLAAEAPALGGARVEELT